MIFFRKLFLVLLLFLILWTVKGEDDDDNGEDDTNENDEDQYENDDNEEDEHSSTKSDSTLARNLTSSDWHNLYLGNNPKSTDAHYFTCRLRKAFIKNFKGTYKGNKTAICQDMIGECLVDITVRYSDTPPLIFERILKNGKREVTGILKGKNFVVNQLRKKFFFEGSTQNK